MAPMMSGFSGWHVIILIVTLLVLVGIGFVVYFIARAAGRAGSRDLRQRPEHPTD
jgi:uncharacterized membrane protein